jgi:UDP-3-O-[3-hydroxymyristoyl] glucosamine N-acyltransferase
MYNIATIQKCLPIEFSVLGNVDVTFDKINSLFDSKENSLTWVRSSLPGSEKLIENCLSSVIICDKNVKPSELLLSKKAFIIVEKPDVAFLRLVKCLLTKESSSASFIHPTAIISEKAKLGIGVSIGAYSIIGECEIGDNSVIETFAKIHDRTVLGKNVLISEYCNIGGEGFGHITNEFGEFENMLHIGNTIIEDNVEIFPYTNIDRGTLSSTIIKKNTKIDHHCHIAHNSFVGENTVITAKVILGGGSSIGNFSWIGLAAIIRDKVSIGNHVVLGMGSCVVKNIPDGETWMGSPARPIDEVKLQMKKIAAL